MKTSEAYFIPHCDDEFCTLGTLEFGCPSCGKHNVNYDNYYDDELLYKGEKIHLECEHCNEPLSIELIDYDNIVKKYESTSTL
jgi:Zn finger protein HypA/HybF involved in hydrogenase expression